MLDWLEVRLGDANSEEWQEESGESVIGVKQ